MNLTRCENGHFYDVDKHQKCPHCENEGDDRLTERKTNPSLYTVPIDQTVSSAVVITSGQNNSEDPVTVAMGKSKAIGFEPVVGWLVCVGGIHVGEDFRLKAGRNFIGRSGSMDVFLSRDITVSREKHAIVVYDPKSLMFLLQPGESHGLSYLNDNLVLTPTKLNPYDVLVIGETKLMFFPCCSEIFNWDMVKTEGE